MPNTYSAPRDTSKLGVVIRFKNSASTLPAVLEGLHRQTRQPDVIVGVNNQSADNSSEILRAAGADIIDWNQPYHHPSVLNFALAHCKTDLVVILSSHTVLHSSDAIEKLVAAMADQRTACASGKWDDDSFYSDAIEWAELTRKGLTFCSIYSNSMGILRRSLWRQIPFDESIPTLEDGAWALEQVKRGFLCRRVSFCFDYRRVGQTRFYAFAVIVFQIASRHGLPVRWLGVIASLRLLISIILQRIINPARPRTDDLSCIIQRLLAAIAWRFIRLRKE